MPVFIVINKIDLCSKIRIQHTIACLKYLLEQEDSSCQLLPCIIEEEKDLVKTANMFIEKRICPIFLISCVTGENIILLKIFQDNL